MVDFLKQRTKHLFVVSVCIFLAVLIAATSFPATAVKGASVIPPSPDQTSGEAAGR